MGHDLGSWTVGNQQLICCPFIHSFTYASNKDGWSSCDVLGIVLDLGPHQLQSGQVPCTGEPAFHFILPYGWQVSAE